MAEGCPCGCGRRVGWSKTGFAKAYRGCTTIIENVTPLMDIVTDERDRAETAWALSTANYLQTNYLEHLHGKARPDRTPDGMVLARKYVELAAWYESLATAFGTL